jgi:Domain of unknown function (DUF4382)/Domain of unknown function (DUF5666)
MARFKRLQLTLAALTVGLASVLTLSCGGGRGATLPPVLQGPSGSVSFLAADAPLCDVAAFNLTFSSATLTPATGGSPVSVISSSNPVTVDFASLVDFSTVLNLLKVPQGTYSQLNLTISNPQITVLDATKSPPQPVTMAASLPSLSLSLPLIPSLVVSGGSATSLELDFDLRNSIQTQNGEVTGEVTPVMTASAVAATSSGFGEIEDLVGIVQSVTSTSTNSAFKGSFSLQSPSGATVTVYISNNTVFDGASGLSGLKAGSTFVEVAAFVDSGNNVVARHVAAEASEDASKNRAAFIGLITSITRSSGVATQFTLLVRQEAPDVAAIVPLQSNLTVTVNSSTTFGISAPSVNQGNLPFDASALGVGQAVVVHGIAQASPPASMTADAVFLSLQSIVGNFSPTPQPVIGNDEATGGFTLVPCSTLFGGQNITVFTFNSTTFPGVANSQLGGLTSTPTLVTKGLIFFSPITVNVNGESALPPATVEEANQVHQLP